MIPQPVREIVEGPSSRLPGHALDLGCGTGTQSVYLVQHGWTATGVDVAPYALLRARQKALAAGVSPRFVTGDVTRLQDLDLGTEYDLLLDAGCFHGLTPKQRVSAADGITQAAGSGAIFLILSFAPAKRGPMPHGVSRDEVLHLFGGEWDLEWQRKADNLALPAMLKRADPSWYCLRKR